MTSLQKAGLIIGGLLLLVPAISSAQQGCWPQSGNCHYSAEGFLDSVSSDGVAAGWAYSRLVPNQALDVHIYIDKPTGVENNSGGAGSVTANEYRADLCGAIGSCNHGFTFKIPARFRDGRQHTIWAYGIDPEGKYNPQLSGAPKIVTLNVPAAPTATISVNPASITVGASAALTWSSTNATACTGTNFTASGLSGSVTVNPTQTTTYSITCTGDGGSVTQSATLTVAGGGGTDTGPRGWLESALPSGTVSGWAQDIDTPSLAIDVHFYTDNASGTKEFIGSVNANQYRADLCSALGSCNHGFTFNVPAKYFDGQSHVIHAYGINAQGGSDKNLELSGSPKTVTFAGSGNGNFKASPQSGTAPLTVGFTGNTNRINSIIDFGDGTSRPVTNFADPPTGTGVPMNAPFAETYTYQAAGTYTAKLKDMNVQCVTTPCDGEVVGTVTVTVTGGTSNPDKFNATPTSGTAPLNVQFSGKSLPEGTYMLDFGDAQKVTLNNLFCTSTTASSTCAFSYSHTYASNGTYTAKLSYSNPALEMPDQQIGTVTITVGTTGGGSCLVIENELGQGDTDDDTNGEVSKLQAFLAKDPAIYPEAKVTGFYGSLTFKAVQRFQKAHGIPETGYVGPKTRDALACKEIPSGATITVTVSPSSVQQGATTTISWVSKRAPANTAVSLRLLSAEGKRRGLIAVGLATTSSYSWRIPYASSDPFDIIEGIASCDTAGVCSGTLAAGSYKIQAALYSPANAFEEELPTKVIATSSTTPVTVTAKTAQTSDPVANLAAAAAALAKVIQTLQGR